MQREDQSEYGTERGGCDGGHFAIGLLAGAAIGAGLALLYAPQSGGEAREDLRDAGATIRDRTTETLDEAKATVEEWIDRARQTIDETRNRLDAAVDAGHAAYDRKRIELDAQVDASLDA